MIESLRIQTAQLKRENDKKESMVQDLLKKLHDAIDTIKVQAHQIKGKNRICCFFFFFFSKSTYCKNFKPNLIIQHSSAK
jgi:cysteine sulfinate desulfinase/cysteine desulfurase-like protein